MVPGQSGKTVDDVAASIRNDPSFRPVLHAYRIGDRVITLNNRTLANYVRAGIKPENVIIKVPSQEEYARLLEMAEGPTMTVPVTISRKDPTPDPAAGPDAIDIGILWPKQ